MQAQESKLPPVQVLVVANVTVDETFAVATIPKPGESLIGEFRSRDVGGKGANVATVLARCGVSTRLIAGIGQDERGEFVHRELSQEPLQIDLMPTLHYPTDLSLIYTDSLGENSIVTTVAAAQSIDSSQACHAMKSLQKPGFLVLQGNLGRATTHQLIQDARSLGVQVVLNPSPISKWLLDTLQLADILVLNEGEAGTLTGLAGEAAVQALLRLGSGQVVVTRGGNGAMLGSHTAGTEHGFTIETVATIPATVIDTTGAGDTYLGAALASAILRSVPLDALALRHAAQAAAITVSCYGTRSAFPEVSALMHILASR